ncbi:MAG: STAS domain-containing protein [Magnetococcales bacterium]|nr:STAS domain-containing protein [Magnetococcales bacterium]
MIITNEFNNFVTIRLPAEFNFKLHREFREAYLHRPPGLTYELDFRDVVAFDSAAMGMMLLMRNHCGDENAKIHLINFSDKILKMLEIAHFNIFFIMGK